MATGAIDKSLINSLNQASATETAKAAKNKNDPSSIGGNEFLQLLITQLKNQDPMDPMKNDQFAVDMAQFTQVEQLIKINDKLDAQANSGSTDLGSLASYLGREVSINSDTLSVDGNDGGRIRVNLPKDASSVTVEILNTDGSVAETIDGGAIGKGKHSIALENLTTTEGSYKYRVKAKDASGVAMEANAKVAGIVSGFIPGSDPKLVLGSREISPSDIAEVNLAS